MVAPDEVTRGSISVDGRESVRFEKRLSNGVVLVVEKEQKNSPDDMDTITMWAEMSSRGADARSEKRPLQSTSTPANNDLEIKFKQSNAVTVITSFDNAKIRKDAEIAIKKMKFFRCRRAVNFCQCPTLTRVACQDAEDLGHVREWGKKKHGTKKALEAASVSEAVPAGMQYLD